MTDLFKLRRDFVQRFDIDIPAQPRRDLSAMRMWETLLAEEWAEFQTALADYKSGDEAEGRIRDMAEVTAEAVDVLNVIVGLLLSQGLPVEAMTQAIHEANMRKCDNGRIVRRNDGKILKPEGWQPADKEAVIRSALPANRAVHNEIF